MAFNLQQIRTFVARVKKEAGPGWDMFGPRIQKALIAEGALSVVRSQAAETVAVESVNSLYDAMLAEAGLE